MTENICVFIHFFRVGQPLMSEISDSLSTLSICIRQLLAPCICHRECNINQYSQLLQCFKKQSWPPQFTAQKNNIWKKQLNSTKCDGLNLWHFVWCYDSLICVPPHLMMSHLGVTGPRCHTPVQLRVQVSTMRVIKNSPSRPLSISWPMALFLLMI